MLKQILYYVTFFGLFSSHTRAMEERQASGNLESQTRTENISSISHDDEGNEIIYHPSQNNLSHITIKTRFSTPIKDIKSNQEGNKVAVIAKDCSYAQIWDLETKKLSCELHGHDGPIRCILFHPTGKFIFTGSDDKTIKCWNFSGQCIKTLKITSKKFNKIDAAPITSLAFSENNPFLLLIGLENSCCVIRRFHKNSISKSEIIGVIADHKRNLGSIVHGFLDESSTRVFLISDNGTCTVYTKHPQSQRSKGPITFTFSFSHKISKSVKIESIYAKNNYTFVKLKNLQTNCISYLIFKYNELNQCNLFIPNAVDYCLEKNTFLEIQDNLILERSLDSLQEKCRFEVEGNPTHAMYEGNNNDICVTLENGISKYFHMTEYGAEFLLELETHSPLPSSALLLELPNNMSISSNLDDRAFHLWEPADLLLFTEDPKESITHKRVTQSHNTGNQNHDLSTNTTDSEHESDSDVGDNSDYDDTESYDTELLIDENENNSYDSDEDRHNTVKRKRELAKKEKLPQAKRQALSHCDSEEHESEDAPEHETLEKNTRESEHQLRYEQEVQQILSLYALIKIDKTLLKKSLFEVIDEYQDDVITKYIGYYKGDLNAQDNQGRTAIYRATELGKKQTVKLLAKRKADVNVPNTESCTPLHVAIAQGYEEIAACLLYYQASVSPKNKEGSTPLHLAIQSKNIPLIKLLLAANADLHAIDNSNNTPLSLVITMEDADLLKLFGEKLLGMAETN